MNNKEATQAILDGKVKFIKNTGGYIYTLRDIGRGLEPVNWYNNKWSNLWSKIDGNWSEYKYKFHGSIFTECDNPKELGNDEISKTCNHNWQDITLFTSVVTNCANCGAKKE